MKKADPSDVLTLTELSQYLRMAESSLYKLTREGKIPGKKVGKIWRFFRPAIDQWLSGAKLERPPIASKERRPKAISKKRGFTRKQNSKHPERTKRK